MVTGPVAQKVGDAIGLGEHGGDVGHRQVAGDRADRVARSSLALLGRPNVKQPGFRWVTPGGILAVVLWIVASALFAFYVANFSSYNKTYGAWPA